MDALLATKSMGAVLVSRDIFECIAREHIIEYQKELSS